MASQDTEPKVEEVKGTEQNAEAEEEMPALENQPKQDKKLNKAEKKCIKHLNKMGLKSLSGITRVTLKRRDGIIFVISNPEVYKSPTSENSYVVVGELKMDEPRIDNLPTAAKPAATGQAKTSDVQTDGSAKASDKAADSKEEDKTQDSKTQEVADGDDENLDESSLTPMHIDMVMQNASCTRSEAVKALIASNNDMVNAIMHLSK